MSVSIALGQIAVLVIPRFAFSTAIVLVRSFSACLATTYGAIAGLAILPRSR